MAQNLTNFDAALKIDYLPVIREQLNNASILLNRVQRNERDVSGKRWQMTAHYARNSGVGAGAETNLPTAGNQAFKNPYDTVAYNRARIQVSGKRNVGPAHRVTGGNNYFSGFGEHPINMGQYRANLHVLCLINSGERVETNRKAL